MINDIVKELLTILEPKAKNKEVIDAKVRSWSWQRVLRNPQKSSPQKEQETMINLSSTGNGCWFHNRRNSSLLFRSLQQQYEEFQVGIPSVGFEDLSPDVRLLIEELVLLHVARWCRLLEDQEIAQGCS